MNFKLFMIILIYPAEISSSNLSNLVGGGQNDVGICSTVNISLALDKYQIALNMMKDAPDLLFLICR